MAATRSARRSVSLGEIVACALALVVAWIATPGSGAPLPDDEIAALCAKAEGTWHCGRLIEEAQLKRLPNLATREGITLKVSLYPAGVASFTDTEALNGGRSYSLWDYLDPINAVLLYTTDGDTVTYTLLQRSNGRKVELPNEPKVSPDRQRLVTADFCESRCVNELAVWRVSRDGVRKELSWKPKQPWSDAGATWKDAETLTIEYTPAGGKSAVLDRRLSEPGWTRVSGP